MARRRSGCLLKVLVLVLLLVAVLGVGDRLLLSAAESEGESRVADELAVDEVSLRLDSLPFLPRLVLGGQVERIDLDLTGLEESGVRFERVEIDLDDVVIDRAQARQRRVVVESIGRGTATVTLSDDELSRIAGIEVVLGDGTVAVGGVQVPLPSVALVDGTLRLGLEGVGEVAVPVPTEEVVPCSPSVRFAADELQLACTLDEVPPVLARLSIDV